MQAQAEGSQKNELNYFNGKVGTLQRDLAIQNTFTENL